LILINRTPHTDTKLRKNKNQNTDAAQGGGRQALHIESEARPLITL